MADSAFEPAGSDRVVTVLRASPMREAQIYARLQSSGLPAPRAQGEAFADPDGHRYVVVQQGETEPWRLEEQPPRIDALRLSVDDLAESIQFYGERLGLTPVGASPASATFATGNVDLVLEQAVPPVIGTPPRWGFLTVFYTPDIQKTRTSLMRAGVPGITDARFSQIGGTARFKDPTGHRICLYQPSEECFGWESGALLQQIVSGPSARRCRRRCNDRHLHPVRPSGYETLEHAARQRHARAAGAGENLEAIVDARRCTASAACSTSVAEPAR